MRQIPPHKQIALEQFNEEQEWQTHHPMLRTLFWECTLRCNLSCRHCGSDCKNQSSIADMPAADFLKVIDTEITPNVDPNIIMVVFAGGEVLLRDDLEYVGYELYKRGYPWGMVTNGMALTKKRLKSLLAAGLHSITVSLDGFEDTHNYIRGNKESYKNALNAAKLISRVPYLANDIVTCVIPATIPQLREFKEMLIRERILNWRLFTIFPAGRAKYDKTLQLSDADFIVLMEFIKECREEGKINVSYICEGFLGGYEGDVRNTFYHCSAGVTAASILIDGSISGCTSIRSKYGQGNIYKDGFWDVWSNGFKQYRDREWMHKGACGECNAWEYCKGGAMHLRDNEGEFIMCRYNQMK